MPTPTLEIIIASTRPGRIGLPVATWFASRAEAHGGFSVELVDLAAVGLPFLDEPHHPRLGQYTKDHTRAWSATVARADAFAMVVPEYNHGFNGALKNAVDFLYNEWQNKPVGFVSYGGVAAGTRAVQMLKPVVASLKMVPVVEAVSIPFVAQFLDPEGQLAPDATVEKAATALLDELLRWGVALAPRRAPEPG